MFLSEGGLIMYFDSEAHKERFNELCAVYAGKSREFKRLNVLITALTI